MSSSVSTQIFNQYVSLWQQQKSESDGAAIIEDAKSLAFESFKAGEHEAVQGVGKFLLAVDPAAAVPLAAQLYSGTESESSIVMLSLAQARDFIRAKDRDGARIILGALEQNFPTLDEAFVNMMKNLRLELAIAKKGGNTVFFMGLSGPTDHSAGIRQRSHSEPPAQRR